MRVIRFYIGLEKNKDGLPILPSTRMQQAHKRLAALFGGCTEYSGTGSWLDGSTLVCEKCAILEVLVSEETTGLIVKARALAKELATQFDQKSVAMTLQTVDTIFFS